MFTFTSSNTFYQTLTNNVSSTNQTNGNTWINQFTLELVHKYPFINTEQTFTGLQTFPSQQYYNLSSRIRRLGTVVINVGNGVTANTSTAGFNWPVLEAPSRQFWNNLNLTNNVISDTPQYWFFFNGQLGIYPKPASGYNPITLTAQVEVTSLSVADYTTGTITAVPYTLTLTGSLAVGAISATLSASWTLPTGTYQLITSGSNTVLALFTNGSTTVTWTQALTVVGTSTITIRTANGGDIVTGSGTTWATYMQGFLFQITQTTGDGFPYKIETVYSTTMLSLTAPYEGLAIASGSAAYTIGQTSIIPQSYQLIPIYRAAELYYSVIFVDKELQDKYKDLADSLESTMRTDFGNKSTDPTIEDGNYRPIINPNLTVNTTGSSTGQ